MTNYGKMILGAITDFIMVFSATLTGYMIAKEGLVMPSKAALIVAVLIGLADAAKYVNAAMREAPPMGGNA